MGVEVMDFTSGESEEKKSRFRPKFQGFFSEIKFSVPCHSGKAEATSRLFSWSCADMKNARWRLPSGVEKSKAMEQKRFELSTPTLRTWCSSQLSYCPENTIKIPLLRDLSRKPTFFSSMRWFLMPFFPWYNNKESNFSSDRF